MIRACVRVEEITSGVRIIVRTILITITERELDVLRDDSVLVGEFCLALDLRLLDRLVNRLDGLGVVLADEERRAVAHLAARVALHLLRFPDIRIRETDILNNNSAH